MYDRSKEIPVSKGLGYLNFQTQEEADRCLVEMQGTTIHKKSVVLSYQENEENDHEAVLRAIRIPLDYQTHRIR